MRMIITRHGETEWNLIRRTQGATDTNLTDRGRAQARLLANRLVDSKIDMIYSSTLSRAIETSEIISSVIDVPIMMEKDLKEYSFGIWEGKNFDALKDNYPEIYKIWESTPQTCQIPDAEHFPTYSCRVNKFIERSLEKHADDTILVVSHALTSKLMITNSLNLPEEYIHSFKVENASVNIMNFSDRVVMEKLNDTTHLKGMLI